MKQGILRQALSVLLLGLITLEGVSAMGFFKKPKHCVFSAMSGTLTLNGEPVKNARLVRTGQLGHAESAVTDEFVTDEQGRFAFPDMYQSASEFGLLVAFKVFQTVTVYVHDDEFRIWSGIKNDGLVGSENRGEIWEVTCELTDEEDIVRVNDGVFHTNCVWPVEQDEREDYSNQLFDPR